MIEKSRRYCRCCFRGGLSLSAGVGGAAHSAGYRGGKAEPGGFGRRGAQRSGDVLGAACVVVEPTGSGGGCGYGNWPSGQGGDRPLTPIVRALTDRQALLVLDNCEQVSSACREMVSSCSPPARPSLSSRPAEFLLNYRPRKSSPSRRWVVEASGSDPFEGDAVALFVDRATAVAGGYALTEHNENSERDLSDRPWLAARHRAGGKLGPRSVAARPA